MKKEKREYINVLTEYLFYKYIYSIFLEEKYISNFAKYEIEKMENIYETFIYDTAIENRFIYGMSFSNVDTGLENALAKEEYRDLQNQINTLKQKKEHNSKNLNTIKNILDRGIISIMQKTIRNYDPYLNYDLDTNKEWNLFIKALRNKNFEYIFEIENIDNLEKNIKLPSDINHQVLIYEDKILELFQFFPYNMEKTLSSKSNINQKIKEIKEEILKSKETLRRITNVYLYTDDVKGLES